MRNPQLLSLRHWLTTGALSVSVLVPSIAGAAISWDGGGNSNWWFDPENWSQSAFGYLPPGQDSSGSVAVTDAQINVGSGAWNVTGEGIVYDPDHDPFFASAAGRTYPTGAAFTESEYGPQHLYRLYISRNTTNHNLLTVKSGDLVIESTTVIGRSGSTLANQNSGRVDQLGGRVRFPAVNVEIGNAETSGWGNGTYNIQGGTLEVGQFGAAAIRVGNGGSAGPSGVNRFIIGNGPAGHVRTHDFQMISYRGTNDGVFTAGQDPNGVDRGVATVEFQLQNGATRPVQVVNNLTLNNGVEPTTGAILSSRLVLTLDEAPQLSGGGVPINLGLFDVDYDTGLPFNGIINGFGDLNGDAVVNDDDQIFASADGSSHYPEGSTVSAVFGATRYDWTISYTGDITWTDADNSVVNTISGAGTGTDVVLIGLGSENVGLAGDYNSDGRVDAADYTVWRDGNSPDDTVAGYNLWKNNYGASNAPASSIPEPSAVMLALVGLALAARRR